MKWLEVITLRSLGKANRPMVDQLLAQILESQSPCQTPEVRVYQDFIVETDLSIHICWDTNDERPQPSSLGQQLSYSLKALGLLSHSVWVEAAVSE
jgi:hypothetical protein